MALVILSLAGIALMAAFSTSLTASSTHRHLTDAQVSVDAATQQITSDLQQNASAFTSCQQLSWFTNSSNVPITLPSVVAGSFTASITGAAYWNQTTAAFQAYTGTGSWCVAGVPVQITVTVVNATTGASLSNSFVVTSPANNVIQTDASSLASQLVITTPPSGSAPGVPFITQPIVAIENNAGVPISTDLSPITLQYATSSGSGSTTATGTFANIPGCAGVESNGVVTFTGCEIPTAGNYVVEATTYSSTNTVLTSAVKAVTISGSNPAIVFSTQPVAGASGSKFSTEPVLHVDNPGLSTVDTNWSGSILLCPSGGVLGGGTIATNCATVTVTNGVSAALNLTFEGGISFNPVSNVTDATPYDFVATGTGLVSGTSASFAVSATGPASQLVFTSQPTGVAGSSATASFASNPVVTAEDAFGNVATGFTGTLTLSGSGQTITCSSQSVSSGVVTLTGCHGTTKSDGIVMTAACTGSCLPTGVSSVTSGLSTAFNITGAPAYLGFTVQPLGGQSGNSLAQQPQVTVYDSGGNVVTASTTAITLSTSGGTLSLCSGLTPTEGVINVTTCSFTGLIGTNYYMTATGGGLSATSSSFTPVSAGSATQLNMTVNPVGGASGSTLAGQPVVKIEDAAGNVITSSSATVLLTTSGGTIGGCSSQQAVNGVVNFYGCTFAGLTTGSYIWTASSGSLTPDTSTPFAPSTFGVAAQLAFTTPLVAPAHSGGAFATAPVVSIEDSAGNVVTSATNTISLSASGGALGGCTNPVAATNGVFAPANCTFAGLISGAYTLTASATGLTSATSASFAPVSYGTATRLVYTTQPTNLTASGGVFATQPIVAIEDSAGNVVTSPSASVTIAASGGVLTSCTNTTVTTSAGLATFAGCKFAGLTTGSYNLTATSSGLTAATSASFAPSSYGAASQLVFTTQPTSPATSGGQFVTEPTVSVEDSAGNVVGSASTAITLTPSGGSIGGCANPTAASGGVLSASTCTFAGLTTGSYTITASATGLVSATSSNFAPLAAGAAAQLSFSQQPTGPAISGGAFAQQPVVTVLDSGGNFVATSTVPVTITASGGVLSGCTTNPSTTVAGLATFTGCTFAGLTSGSYTLTASAPGLSSATSSTFKPAAAGSAAQLAFTTQPVGPATSGAVFATQPSVSVEDTGGNVVATSSAAVTIAASGGSLSSCTNTTVTASSGVAAFTGCKFAGLTTGSYTLSATATGLTSATSASFAPASYGSASQLVYTTTLVAPATSGGLFATEPTISVEDAAGNVVTNSTASINLTPSGGTLAGCTNPKNATAGVLAESGCTFAALTSGSYTLTAASSGLTSAVSASFTPASYGAATQLVYTTQPTSPATSGAVFAHEPVLQVEDSAGNVVANAATAITLTPSGGVVGGCTNPGNATNGVLTETRCTFAGLTSGSYTLTASASSLTSAVSSTFKPLAVGSATQVVFTTQPTGPTTSGAVLGTQPMVSVEDSGGNVITTSTASITIAASGGTLSSCTNTTVAAVAGIATFANCKFAGLTTGSYTLSASATGLTSGTSSAFAPAGFGTAAQLAFTTQPTGPATSGALLGTQPKVSVEDSGGNVVTSSTASITIAASGGTLSSCTNTTVAAVAGVATFANCKFAGLTTGSYTLSATATSLTTATSSSFAPTSYGTATQLVFSTQPTGPATSGEVFATQPAVSVEDAAGNVVGNSTTSITITASGGTLSSCTNTTVAAVSGVATFANCKFAGLTSGSYTLSATATGLSTATSNTFKPGAAGTAAQLAFTTQPTGPTTSGAVLGTQPKVSVEDSGGNVITTSTASITIAASGGTLSSCTNTTVAAVAGVATFANCKFNGLTSGSYTLSATSTGLTTATSANFAPLSFGTATQVVFTTDAAAPATSGAVLATQPVVSVEDADGNVVTSSTASITIAASGGTLSSCTNTTVAAVAGVATFSSCTFAGLTTGTYTLSASSGVLSGDTSPNIAPLSYGTASQLVFTVQPTSPSYSGAVFGTEPTVSVEDSAGNVVGSSTASITLAASGGTLSSCSSNPLAASAGVAAFTGCKFTGSTYTNYTLTGKATSLTTATSASFKG